MAYTRISTGDVARACDKFKIFFEKQQQEKIKKRKSELMARLWSLSEYDSLIRATYEIENESKSDDYIIYEQLRSISSVGSPSGFITIDSYEADFIYRMRKLKNE